MINIDVILLIMNCKKYEYKALYQKNTWLKDIHNYLKYYHVIGEKDMSDNLEYKFDDEKNILWVNTPDDYNSLPQKVISAYDAIQKTFNFTYILKTDDDQMLTNAKFLETIIKIINTKNPKIHYAGHIVDVPIPYLSKYSKIHPELPDNIPIYKTKYCNGRFYILSKEAIKDLIYKRNFINKEYLEDYAIGFYLNDKYKESMMEIQSDKYFKDIIFDQI
jgi:hypothetical protein